jgi:hypothetical protein
MSEKALTTLLRLKDMRAAGPSKSPTKPRSFQSLPARNEWEDISEARTGRPFHFIWSLDTFYSPKGIDNSAQGCGPPLPWVSYHHEFPSLKGMNTPTGELSIPFRDGLNKNGLIPRVVR